MKFIIHILCLFTGPLDDHGSLNMAAGDSYAMYDEIEPASSASSELYFEEDSISFNYEQMEAAAWIEHQSVQQMAAVGRTVDDLNQQMAAVVWIVGGLINSASQHPASREQIDALSTSVVDSSHVQSSCSICLESFRRSEEIKHLPCGHFFHSSCINQWLEIDNRCPCCREPCHWKVVITRYIIVLFIYTRIIFMYTMETSTFNLFFSES